MTNIFQSSYEARLQNWHRLRKTLEGANTETICVEVDKWWQKAPLVNHYLHVDFVNDWPGPWELISENNYCYIARGLGMVYTLHLLGISDIEFIEARDYNGEDVALVLVDNAYILNYWPGTVQTNKISDFTLKNTISIDSLKEKLK